MTQQTDPVAGSLRAHLHRIRSDAGLATGMTAVSAGHVLLLLAIVVGQFSLSRLFDGRYAGLLSIKLPLLALSIALLWPLLRRSRALLLQPAFLIFGAAVLYMIATGAVAGTDLALAKSIDLLVLLTLCFAFAAVCQELDRDGVRLMIVALLALTLALHVVELGQQFWPRPRELRPVGFGWGAGLFSSISFNRIAFLACCVGLIVCWLPDVSRGQRVALLAAAAFFLFGAIGSLQKAGIAGAGLALSFMAGAYAWHRAWWPCASIFAIIAPAMVLTSLVFGDTVPARYRQGFEVTGALGDSVVPPPVRLATALQAAGSVTRSDALPLWFPVSAPATSGGTHAKESAAAKTSADYRTVLSLRTCQYEPPEASEKSGIGAKREIQCKTQQVADGTGRLALAVVALQGIAEKPLFGHGLGSYRADLVHPSVLQPDVYRYPHNFLLEVAYEGGLVGVVLFAVAFVAVAAAAVMSKAPLTVSAPFLGFAIFMGVSVMFAGDIYDSRLMWLALFGLSGWPNR